MIDALAGTSRDSPAGQPAVAAERAARPWMNPYVAGVGIGLVMLAAFAIMGRGLGASGAFSTVVSAAVAEASPGHAAGNSFYGKYLGDGSKSPLADWLLFEILGVTLGGLASAWLAGRFRWTTDRGAGISTRGRLTYAAIGGITMGFGAKLARGCSSGLALTGGALLAPGAWIFVGAAFAAGYAVAPLVRRQWM